MLLRMINLCALDVKVWLVHNLLLRMPLILAILRRSSLVDILVWIFITSLESATFTLHTFLIVAFIFSICFAAISNTLLISPAA
jgi:hypothetical protein